ncbi:GldG family protein [Ideonella sp. DXS22W]|uniref:GldG family protein n=1 Tax=Pseudaquabacterium inlustre TaxID=2984192 RepID=A0ABU9CHM3_9BURK
MGIVWALGVLAALVVLFAAGLRAPLGRGRGRIVVRAIGVVAALGAVLAANVIVFRHDQHFDVTHEQAFTPAPETRAVLEQLTQDVELVYFYQAQNPAARAAKTMVEIMGREYPRLKVRTVDPDQTPALANRYGVRMYNAALLMAGGQRIEVATTEDREIALGILRLLRRDPRPVCFLTGHGEYDPENFEFHTHFEGSQGHNHDAGGMTVVNMQQHGIGRLRRALDKLGYAIRKVGLATGGAVPADCAALILANPRTPFAPPEVDLLGRYLQGGGNLLALLEPDYAVSAELQTLLGRAGVSVGDGVIVDPLSHYFTDEQMVAVEKYAAHPASVGLALSFFPGARPLQAVAAPGVKTTVLFSTSAQATVVAQAQSQRAADGGGPAAVRPLAIAAEGTLPGGARPFRLAVVGDADFASNSFYPFLANADLALGLTAWLRGEPRGVAMKPPVEVIPLVTMTNQQMQLIFVLCVIGVPGLCALAGAWVWWRRRF